MSLFASIFNGIGPNRQLPVAGQFMERGKGNVESIPDSELIVKLQANSLDALGVLYDRHRNLVYRTALAITGDPDAASDLLQDVFLRLHRFAHHIDPARPLESWLYRMTANLAYTWIKRRRRWLNPLEDMAEWPVGGWKDSPAYHLEEEETTRQVREAISSLPLSHRGVVALYYVNDLSVQEIAEIMEVPVGTIKSRLHYGRQALKKHLGFMDGGMLCETLYEFT